jgi:hypothetical protein
MPTFQWFSRSRTQNSPSYSLLGAVPSRGLPQELADRETSSDHQGWRDQIERDLLAQEFDEDQPSFLTFLKCGNCLLQMALPQVAGGCLLAFSTPLRAADYASVAAPKQTFEYFCSSPKQVVFVINEFSERASVRHIALDRCPRCEVFTTLKAANFDSAAKVIQVRNIVKATEMARCGLYWAYARSAARGNEFLCARDVALELVGHVTPEDPRSHLLLGKLAIRLHDKQLLREAREFLAVLKQDWAIKELEIAGRTRVFEF